MTTTAQSPSVVDAPPVLDVKDLSVTFQTETGSVSAVDHVNLSLAPGEIVGIVGESGCGKSVTVDEPRRAAAPERQDRRLRATQGQELVGASPSALRAARGRDIAYIFQEPMSSLNPVLTVGRQIAEVLQVHERLSRKEVQERTVELLELVGIPSPRERVKHYPHQLSGGMRQRVMIAMAVACSPKVLIADEPTTALDVTVQAGILDVLQGPAGPVRHEHPDHHPRPRRDRRHRRPRGGHVCRSGGRAGRPPRAVRTPPAPLHRRTALRLTDTGSPRRHPSAAGDSRARAGPVQTA